MSFTLLPLQMEYFRRYQLDVQRSYYQARGREHARAVRRSAWWRVGAPGLVIAAAVPLILNRFWPRVGTATSASDPIFATQFRVLSTALSMPWPDRWGAPGATHLASVDVAG
jgi:hypothetical protein